MNSLSKNRRRGKRAQQKISEIFEGFNVGTLGKIDVLTEKFAIEVKDKAKFVGEQFLQQAEKYLLENPLFKEKIPLAIVHIRKKPFKKSIVLIRLEEFLKLIQDKT